METQMEREVKSMECYQPFIIERIVRRIIDIVAGLVGCFMITLVYIYVKIAYIKDNDHGPIVFTQDRIGKDGKLFKMYKFRTMVPNADQILLNLMEKDENIKREYQINKKLENDPRITNVGRFLRNTSLDEFPQLVNVLLGQMSLVGPRPYLPREKEDMGSSYHAIIQCKSGITGPWQIGGRNDVTFQDRCSIDLDYIAKKSFTGDLLILFKTFMSVVGKTGAK